MQRDIGGPRPRAPGVDAALGEMARQIRLTMHRRGMRKIDLRRLGYSQKQVRKASAFLNGNDEGWGFAAAYDLASRIGVPVEIRVGGQAVTA